MKPSDRDLEVQEDIPFEERAWKVQRVGWALMFLLVIGALLGLLGSGPLSQEVLWDRSSRLRVEFNRFERYQAPTTLRLRVDADLTPGKELPITLNRDFVDQIEIKRIDPEPDRVETGRENFHFYFAARPDESANIVFHYEPNRFGKMPIRVSVSNHAEIKFEQMYFP